MLARSRLGLDLIAKDNFFFINQNAARQLDLGDTKMQLDLHVYSLFVTYRPHF